MFLSEEHQDWQCELQIHASGRQELPQWGNPRCENRIEDLVRSLVRKYNTVSIVLQIQSLNRIHAKFSLSNHNHRILALNYENGVFQTSVETILFEEEVKSTKFKLTNRDRGGLDFNVKVIFDSHPIPFSEEDDADTVGDRTRCPSPAQSYESDQADSLYSSLEDDARSDVKMILEVRSLLFLII